MEIASLENMRKLLVDNCMLTVSPEEIQDDTLLFGPGSLGLDSIDALQLSLSIESSFQTPIKDPEIARQILSTPGSIRSWINKQKGSS